MRKHNQEVDKNRHILSKTVDCVKFCGAFQLALRGHDETDSSDNPGIFRGLVDFVASQDSVLVEHLKTATVFKGTFKMIQKAKLVAQGYDGASVMRGATGRVQLKIMDVYEHAHYVHCYAYQLNLIMLQTKSHMPRICTFLSDLAVFSAFFSRSPKRTTMLDQVVVHRLPRASPT